MIGTLGQIAALFAGLSLLAVGGGNGVIPDMQRAAVDLHHWVTNPQFLDLFAISRAAPGPGSLLVVLIGQRAAGLAGGLVAAGAMYGPACLTVYGATRVWGRFHGRAWRAAAERALAPVAVGLTYGSGLVLVQTTEHGPRGWGITAVATLLLSATELHPLLVMAGAAAIGAILGG
jgi:chromate transporter